MSSFQVTRRNLPHWQEAGQVYFITWRCRGDQTLTADERSIVLQSVLFWHEKKWTVYAAVIMPNHVHLLAQPLFSSPEHAYNLNTIIHSIKSYTALMINRARGTQGSLWQDERLDRIVRDDAELLEKWQYLRYNPVRAGLSEAPEDYPWLYEKP